jgi:hypothetical protein
VVLTSTVRKIIRFAVMHCPGAGIFLFAFLMATASTAPALASPAYGTRLPAAHQVFWGVQHYYIAGSSLDNNLGVLSSQQSYLAMSYGLTKWLALDLKWNLYGTFRHKNSSGAETVYKDSVWGGGYGFRLRLYESNPIRVIAGFQHFSIHPAALDFDGVKQHGILEDWQGSLLVSRHFSLLSPYLGIRYNLTDYIRYTDDERKMYKADGGRRVGLVCGVDVPLTEKTWVNLEADWQDGLSLAAALHWHF